jgi:hypothetical protein
VPEPGDGDLSGHGDGGRVDQLFHAGADEGDAEQVAVVFPIGPAPITITSYTFSGAGPLMIRSSPSGWAWYG